jgi:hypothetical protein
MKHYSEADLLETYYTQPGASMPVMMHLAECPDCAARYESIEKKLRSLNACEEQPEIFWARQRSSILQSIERRRSRGAALPRLAAAAALVIAIGGLTLMRNDQPAKTPPAAFQTATTATAAAAEDALQPVPADPWESEQLSDFQSVVAWESWVENGDQSL